MFHAFRYASAFILIVALIAIGAPADQPSSITAGGPGGDDGSRDEIETQLQIVRIAARVDGSGRIVFTRGKVFYEHKHWGLPANVLFDGTPWSNIDTTPAQWTDYGSRLDLTKAWVVKRHGRDVIALEHTPDGFDLYLSDSPKGAADYEVTIAIPRRN